MSRVGALHSAVPGYVNTVPDHTGVVSPFENGLLYRAFQARVVGAYELTPNDVRSLFATLRHMGFTARFYQRRPSPVIHWALRGPWGAPTNFPWEDAVGDWRDGTLAERYPPPPPPLRQIRSAGDSMMNRQAAYAGRMNRPNRPRRPYTTRREREPRPRRGQGENSFVRSRAQFADDSD